MKRLYHYVPMLLLSIFVIILIILAEAVFFTRHTLLDAEIYKSAMDQKSVSTAMHGELVRYFTSLSSATGIPPEVFNDPLDEDELYTASYSLLKSSLNYLTDKDAPKPESNYDFSKLEKSITDYVENDAQERGIEKDEEYQKLLDNTISIADQQVASRLDMILLKELSNTGVGEKIHKYSSWLMPIFWVLVGLAALLVVGMVIIDRHHPRDLPYWAGIIIAVSGGAYLLPAYILHKTGYFSTFFIKNEYIHNTVTGAFEISLNRIIKVQLIVLIIGLLLVISAQVIHVLYLRHLKKQWKKTHWNEDREPDDEEEAPEQAAEAAPVIPESSEQTDN
ncbi:MAG: hypothetical protein IJ561_07465 [Ruminococcus sp.]|nr:hypothetical protein [Ruminococcus sp.]